MATPDIRPEARPAPRGLERLILANPLVVGLALLAVSYGLAAFTIVAVVMVFTSGWAPIVPVWTGFVASVFHFGAVYLLWPLPILRDNDRLRLGLIVLSVLLGTPGLPLALFFGALATFSTVPGEEGGAAAPRLVFMAMGGLIGLSMFVFSVLLMFGPWAGAFIPAEGSEISALKVWRESWWRILIDTVLVLSGLGIMFGSLQLGRTIERSNATVRRLVYGFNTALTGLLLFCILGFLNVLSYVPLPPFSWFDQQIDWTPSQMFSLSDRSIALLKNDVKGQVTVYALLSHASVPGKHVEQLVQNCKRYKDIELNFYDPDTNPEKFLETMIKYGKHLDGDERGGIIVVYRDEDGKEDAAGIRASDLVSPQRSQDGMSAPRFVYKGENALMKVLRKLSDKGASKIVFTKGHGELEINRSVDASDRGKNLSELRDRLQSSRNYDFSEVTLGPEGASTSLAGADLVVIARPTRPFSEEAIKPLREYLNPRGTERKGKLIVLLDKQVRDGKMLEGKLIELLREQGVEVSDKRVLSFTRQPSVIDVSPPARATNPIARAFAGAINFTWRFVEPRKVGPVAGGQPTTKVETILETDSEMPVWEEGNLTEAAAILLQRYLTPETPKDQKPRLLTGVATAVAVSEGRPRAGMPMDPQHMGLQEQVPRMVVFGDASWATSDRAARDNGLGISLFDSCISWLRGKSDLGAENFAEDKERPDYNLANKGFTKGPKLQRLLWLPLVLALVAIVSFGVGLWVIRRR